MAGKDWYRSVPQVLSRYGWGTERQVREHAATVTIVPDDGGVTVFVDGVTVRMSVGQAMQVASHLDAAVAEVERRDDEATAAMWAAIVEEGE